jgi:hypothetical protein
MEEDWMYFKFETSIDPKNDDIAADECIFIFRSRVPCQSNSLEELLDLEQPITLQILARIARILPFTVRLGPTVAASASILTIN